LNRDLLPHSIQIFQIFIHFMQFIGGLIGLFDFQDEDEVNEIDDDVVCLQRLVTVCCWDWSACTSWITIEDTAWNITCRSNPN